MDFSKINVRVRDLGAAMEYVRGGLGGEVLREPHDASFGRAAVVRVHGLLMEIVEPAPGTPMAKAIETRGEGIDSIGFTSDDVGAAAAHLEGRAGRLVRPTLPGTSETVWIHPKNPLSISIEVYPAQLGSLFSNGPSQTGQ